MKIAVLTTSSRKAGGLFYSVRWLSKALARKGCQPTIFSPADEYSQEDFGVWDPLSVELYSGFGPMQTSFKLRRMLANSDAELIHLHGIWMDNQWAAMQCQRKSGVPVVVSPRGMLDPWAVQNMAWKKRLVEKIFARKALENATCIHALCRSEVESIRAYGLKNPVALIPNAVELPSLPTPNPQPPTPNRKKQLLFLGRIHPKKGLSELLKGWAKAQSLKSKAFSNWKLLIAGWDDGGYEVGLKAQAAELGLEGSIEFIGPQYGDEKAELLQRVDAFILPSFSEGLPMSVLEAWSYRLPVVITDFCNLPEGFAAEAAIRVEPNADSIAQGLNELTSMSEDTLDGMASKGRKLVEQKFTWPKIAESMQAVYEWCLSGKNPPDCMEF